MQDIRMMVLKLYMAIYLDPCFKDMSSVDDFTKDGIKNVKVKLLKLIEREEVSTNPEGDPPLSQSTPPPPKKTKLTVFFEEMIGSTRGFIQLSSDEIASNEIKRYDATLLTKRNH